MLNRFFKGDKKDAPPAKPEAVDPSIKHEKTLHQIS